MKFLVMIVVLVAACLLPIEDNGFTAQAEEVRAKPILRDHSIFEKIDQITNIKNIDISGIIVVFQTDFSITFKYGSRTDYESNNISLKKDGIKSIDFRYSPNGILLILKMDGCVSKAEVSKRFELGPPQPNATDARDTGVYHSTPWHDGKINFEFLYARPDCLSSVVLSSR